MKPNDVLVRLADGPAGILKLHLNGPLTLKTTDADVQAAQVMLWMQETWPELTTGETLDILHDAIWWITFWAAIKKGDKVDE